MCVTQTKLRQLGQLPRDARICKRSKNVEYCQEFGLDFSDSGSGSDPIMKDGQIDSNFDVDKSVVCYPRIYFRHDSRDPTI